MGEKQMFTIPLIMCFVMGVWSEADAYGRTCFVVQSPHPFRNKQHFFFFDVPKCCAQVLL